MLNITPFTQSDSSRCGPACIKMILGYYGQDVTEEEISRRCNLTYEVGCTDLQMKEAIESYGLGCEIFTERSLEDLEYWVRHHIPVIVNWFSPGVNSDLSDIGGGHSSIVVSIDREKVYLLDPEMGQIRGIGRDAFLSVWFGWEEDPYIQRCEDLLLRLAIVVYPKRLKEIGNET